jgi:hypothetical protein
MPGSYKFADLIESRKAHESRKCAFIAKRANIPVSPTVGTHRIYTVT